MNIAVQARGLGEIAESDWKGQEGRVKIIEKGTFALLVFNLVHHLETFHKKTK